MRVRELVRQQCAAAERAAQAGRQRAARAGWRRPREQLCVAPAGGPLNPCQNVQSPAACGPLSDPCLSACPALHCTAAPRPTRSRRSWLRQQRGTATQHSTQQRRHSCSARQGRRPDPPGLVAEGREEELAAGVCLGSCRLRAMGACRAGRGMPLPCANDGGARHQCAPPHRAHSGLPCSMLQAQAGAS